VKLYFLRHATASDIAPSDAERPLTALGKGEAHMAGLALAKLGVKPDAILSSPLVRAWQTARGAAEALQFGGDIISCDELQNGVDTPDLLRAIKHSTGPGAAEVVLVGHMPSLAQHIAVLIDAGNPNGLSLGKGAIACVSLTALRPGDGELRWFMRQKQLEKLVH
jgi:phosphohistidine phosphatase